jgi:hypothetical protein
MRSRKPKLVEPGGWPSHGGRARILLESPDLADAGAQAQTLSEAGYNVALCRGPEAALPASFAFDASPRWFDAIPGREATLCPVTCGEACALVDGADLVVTTTTLFSAAEVEAGVRARGKPVLVVEPQQQVDLAEIARALHAEGPPG